MTREEAENYVRSCEEDEGPETYEDAAELFAAIFDRKPDEDDGDRSELWSEVCASVACDDRLAKASTATRFAVWGVGRSSSTIVRSGEYTDRASYLAGTHGFPIAAAGNEPDGAWYVEVVCSEEDLDNETRFDDAVAGYCASQADGSAT